MTTPSNGGGERRVVQALYRLDLPTKVRLLTGASYWRMHAVPAIGLRQVVTSDGPAGVRGESWDERDVAANVPSPTALAATWDPALVEEVGRLLAGEARRKGVDVLLAPTVNLHRSPLGGRHFECFSEDPLLTGRIGAGYVRGVQAGGVAATVKHYVGNDFENERMTVDVRVSERALRELYLAPFEYIVAAARPWAVMAAYNKVNGTTMTENPLLSDPLETDWGFDGVVMSDWTATRSTEAAACAALDLAMPGPEGPWGAALLEAVRLGHVSDAAVDAKVRRLLRLAARVGAVEDVAPAVDPDQAPPGPGPRDEAVRALLRRTAAAACVLVRNDGTLPLAVGSPAQDEQAGPDGDRDAPDADEDGPSTADGDQQGTGAGIRRIAVLGALATLPRSQGGGSATAYPPHVVSPLEGLRAALARTPGGDEVEVTSAVGVVLREGVSPVRPGQVRDPESGDPGVRVRYLDGGGTVLAEEVRLSGRVGWSDPQLEHGAAAVEMLATFTADEPGTWRVGGGGLGPLTVAVDGSVLVDADLRPEAGEEVDFAHFITPPQQSAPLELAAGQQVQLRLHAVPQSVVGLTVVELSVAPPTPGPQEEIDRAVALAREADVAVVVVGTTDLDESEGFDRTTLALPGRQDDLVRAVAAANPRTVVVVNAGSPVLLPWRDEVAAVLLTWFGGQELGDALADVLLGRVEPGGRLPTTWPAREEDVPVLSTTSRDGVVEYAEGLHIGHRAWMRAIAAGGPQPAYWFGHGLGWTTWELADLQVPDGVRLPAFDGRVTDEAAFVRVRVSNTGTRRGRQVVQAYLSRDHSAIDRPALWLAGFAAVEVDPGASVEVDVPLARRAFEHWGGGWAVEPGPYLLTVGFSAGDRPLEAGLDVRLS